MVTPPGLPGRDDVQVTPSGLPGRDDVQAEEMGSESPIEPAQTWSQKEEKKALDQERDEGNGTFQLGKNVGFPPCMPVRRVMHETQSSHLFSKVKSCLKCWTNELVFLWACPLLYNLIRRGLGNRLSLLIIIRASHLRGHCISVDLKLTWVDSLSPFHCPRKVN